VSCLLNFLSSSDEKVLIGLNLPSSWISKAPNLAACALSGTGNSFCAEATTLYNNSSNPVNYKHVNKDYTLNANNLTISYHDDKDFNFINKLSNKYLLNLGKYKLKISNFAKVEIPIGFLLILLYHLT